jgi:hypothetical protein
MRELFRAVLIAGLLVAKELIGDSALKDPLKSLGIPESAAPLVLIGVLIVLYILIDQVVANLAHLPLFRWWVFPHANLEGYWYQKVDVAGRPHSISRISYSMLRNTWVYEGSGYSEAFDRKARWSAWPIEYVDDKEFWIFRGHSARIEDGNELGGGNVVSVLYASTCEPEVRNARRMFGRVLDLDFADAPSGFTIELLRIADEDWTAARAPKSHKLDNQRARALVESVVKRLQTELA